MGNCILFGGNVKASLHLVSTIESHADIILTAGVYVLAQVLLCCVNTYKSISQAFRQNIVNQIIQSTETTSTSSLYHGGSGVKQAGPVSLAYIYIFFLPSLREQLSS